LHNACIIPQLIFLGGTGGLGKEVAKGLVNTDGFSSYKAIVRDATKAKALEDMGWTLVEVPNFFDEVALEQALNGAKTVVSTFGGGDIVKLEIAIVEAAKKVGASLFAPSQFGVDYHRWSLTFPFLPAKQEVMKAATNAGLPILIMMVGIFSDTTLPFLFDLENGKATVVGDATSTVKVSFTRRSDIGKVLAKALTDCSVLPSGDNDTVFLSISGEALSFKEAIEVYERVTGKKIEIEYIDKDTALEQEKELLSKGFQGDAGAFLGSFVLHLKGELERGLTGANTSEDVNSCGVKLETLEETLRSLYT
jgi:uncharacterized protein YbjT (DUF2867 family)